MTGEYGDKAYEKEGPYDKGIMLAVFAEDPGTIRQADLLRDYVMRTPYWNEEFDTTASVGTGKVLQWKIFYGDHVKATFLKDMKETIRTMDRKRLVEAGAIEKKLPVLKIASSKTAYFGSLVLYIGDKNAVLIVGWQIPENVSKPFSQSIEVGKQSLSVELLRGPDVSRYLSPGGAPLPPLPAEPGYSREKAVSGTLHCTPKGKSPDGRSIVNISMENLCFPGTIVELTGAIEARLGLPPPP
jgi:hypothetical protein